MSINLLTRERATKPTPVLFEGPLPLEHIIREGRMIVDPALAERILSEANYSGQRPIRDHHVADLASQIERGLFGAATQIYFILFEDRLHLVNGQHRLRAVVAAGRPVEFQLAIETAETAEALSTAYFRHDRLARHRSTSEVLTAVGIGDRYGISAGLTKSVFMATPLLARRFARPNYQSDPLVRDDAARLAVAQPWWETAATYEAMIGSTTRSIKKRLLNPQVVAVALVTLKHNPERAAKFWGGIANNDGLRKGDPRHTFLANDRDTRGANPTMAAIAATAWNAWFEGRTLGSIRVYDGSPIRIMGTPYVGRRV